LANLVHVDAHRYRNKLDKIVLSRAKTEECNSSRRSGGSHGSAAGERVGIELDEVRERNSRPMPRWSIWSPLRAFNFHAKMKEPRWGSPLCGLAHTGRGPGEVDMWIWALATEIEASGGGVLRQS